MSNVLKIGGRHTHPASGGTGGGGSTALASVTVNNYGASTLSNPEVRFAHVFGATDVPSGSTVTLDVGGTPVPATFARRSTGLNGELRCVDILAKLPASIAASGSATVNLSAVAASSWDDTLPGGKTAAQVVTDLTTNHDALKVQLRGLTNSLGGTEGSGTWTADMGVGLAAGTTPAESGYYEANATGPAAIDFRICAPFKDNTGGAQHTNLWAAFYLVCFLDTTTGAITRISSEVCVWQGKRARANDHYRCQLDLLLGSTVARSWGGNTGDGRTFNFATTAVDTTGNTITLSGHKFAAAQTVQFTTTGTLPAPLATGTDYYVAPTSVGASTIKVYSTWSAANNTVTSTSTEIDLTDQGTGTHTIQGYTDFYAYQVHSLLDLECDWDWHTGITGAFLTRPTYHVVHDNVYYRKTGIVQPIDLSITFANASDPTPAQWSPNTFGGQNENVNTGGLGVSYHNCWNEWQARRLHSPSDRTGYVQSARVRARGSGMLRRFFVDESNLKIMTLNATAYTGLASRVTTYQFDYNSSARSADIPAPSGSTGPYAVSGQVDFSHYYPNAAGNYFLDGGGSNLDYLLTEAAYTMLQRLPGPDASFRYQRDYATSGRTYYPAFPCTQPRSDAFVGNLIADAALAAPDGTPEKTYFKDVVGDTFDFVNWLINTAYGADFRALGGWHIAETNANGPSGITNLSVSGTANLSVDSDETTNFMQSYIGECAAVVCRKWPSTGAIAWATQMATWFTNLWITPNCPAYATVYDVRVKPNPNSGPVFNAPSDIFALDVNSGNGVAASTTIGLVFDTDGTVTRIGVEAYVNADIFPQTGERVYLTDEVDLARGYYGAPVPAAYTLYDTYYVRQSDGAGHFKLATTNSDTTIISSVTPYYTTDTLAANVTSTSSTTITTTGTITFTSGIRFLRIGTELMRVVGGVGTTTLSVDRGIGGSTAATHTAGDTIQVLYSCAWFIDAFNRTTFCPTNCYRHNDTAIDGPIEGHLTLARAACAYLYVAGLLPITAFNNADTFWQQETGVGTSGGPTSFAANNSVVDSAVTSV